ncbi:hypothetical protein ACP70R_023852 [Stipagrostis hirtigluma subsp. patula]
MELVAGSTVILQDFRKEYKRQKSQELKSFTKTSPPETRGPISDKQIKERAELLHPACHLRV